MHIGLKEVIHSKVDHHKPLLSQIERGGVGGSGRGVYTAVIMEFASTVICLVHILDPALLRRRVTVTSRHPCVGQLDTQ